MAAAFGPYQALIWRVDMMEAGQMSMTYAESCELPAVVIESIQFVQQVKAELSKDGAR